MIEREGYTVLCPCARCKLYSGTLCSLYPARYALCPVRVMLLSLSRPRNALSPTDRGIFSIITDLIKDAHLILFLPSTTQVLTFLIDSSRFRYPERAIVFLAVCYLVVGCAYVAGLGAGDSVSCREPFPPPVKLGRLQMMSTITQVSRRRCSSGISFHILFNNFPLANLSLSPSLFLLAGSSPNHRMHRIIHGTVFLLHGRLCVVVVLGVRLVPRCRPQMGPRGN